MPSTPDDPTEGATHQDGVAPYPLFRRDELVSGRFKIVRLIGQGGMGAVYEAEDLELGGHVALKTIRPETAADPRTIERFKQEIYLARKVTHPNVCRIFDLFHHPVPSSGGEVMFVTMELLRGETLAQRLRRTGRMSAAELLPLVTQMADGLHAAHQVGIVHRDFKPSNVVLVPLKENSEEVRAVVTDFGLAHTSATDGSVVLALTGTGDIVGTPAYIAPEVLDNRAATSSTDIYALGVVMYEMATGRLPFAGDTPLSVVLERLRRPAESPRVLVPDLDLKWEAVILRCLEREPADRFANASDVVSSFSGPQLAHVPSLQRRRKRQIAIVATAVAVLTVGIGGFATWATRAPGNAAADAPVATPLKVRRSVAVLGFKNLSQRSDAAWLSAAFSDMLTTELAAGERLRTVSGEQVVRMKLDLQLADAESFAGDTLARIRKNLGTDLVVLGSYVSLGEKGNERIRLDLRVQDAVAGETIASVSDTGTQQELLSLVSRAGAALRDRLGIGELSSSDVARARASQPSNPEVVRLYTEGLTKLRLSENLAARELFEKVIAAAPEYPLAHSALAATWSALGYDGKASESAKRAFELSANLSREERLWIEGRYRESTREREKATEIYRTLFDFFPDNVDYGLRLAAAQTSASKGKDALATLERLRTLPPVLQDDPRIDLAEGRAAGSLSDFKRQLAASDRAAEKAVARGAPVLLAQARLQQQDALGGLGQLEKRVAPLEEARKIYAAAGDRAGVADAIGRMAVVRRLQGDQNESIKLYEQAFEIFREMGNEQGMAIAKSNQANTLMRLGRLPEARKMFEETLVSFRAVGRKDATAVVLNNIAIILRQQGDFEGSMARYEESLAIAREIGMKAQIANALGNMANLLTPRGDLARARKLYEDALSISREINDKTTTARNIGNLSLVVVKQGDVALARKLCEEAVVLTREIGEKREVAYALKHLGNALRHQGELALAATNYEEALKIARAIDEKSLIAETYSGFGHVLLAQGKLAEAHNHYKEALAIRQAAVKNGVADSNLDLARVALEEGRFAEGEALARQTVETYRTFKEPDSIAAVYVVLARTLLAQGKSAAAREAMTVALTNTRATQDQFLRAAVATTNARLDAASRNAGAIAKSIATLKKLAADATTAGLMELRLEADLAIGQLERVGNQSAGLARLAAVQKEASDKGFGLIARNAAAAMR
jgi:serine/threonine protein kinase/tetratricopeptide (TPR) repeat protein